MKWAYAKRDNFEQLNPWSLAESAKPQQLCMM